MGVQTGGTAAPPILRKEEGLGTFAITSGVAAALLCEVWDPLATDASVGIFWGWRGEEGIG